MELTERQMQVMKHLFEAGFRPIAIPPYESALCLRRGECAAVLAPVDGGGFKILGVDEIRAAFEGRHRDLALSGVGRREHGQGGLARGRSHR